jgi:myo-inositol 2-dehydrogenase / D-chiro-inositol 1-dehydrogenase
MYKALIIGAESIGGLIDSPTSKTIASHAHAYLKHPDTKLTALCESSELNVFAFMERWGEMDHYPSVDVIDPEEEYDIVSVASKTSSHFHDLAALLKRSDMSMIVCEKPLVGTIEELSSLSSLLEHSNKKILIHFFRRYNPAFIHLSGRIHKGEFGKSLGFQGICTKGLLHNGSHMLAVLSHFLGGITSLKPFRATHCQHDLCGEFGVSCEQGDGTVSVLANPPYPLFELTLWFEKGVVKILDGGEKIEIYSREGSLNEKNSPLALGETIRANLFRYGYDTVEFLLRKSKDTCQPVLKEHLHIHKLIFQTLSKVYPV